MKLYPLGRIEPLAVVAHTQRPAVVELDNTDIYAVTLPVGKPELNDIVAQLLYKKREHHGFLGRRALFLTEFRHSL